MKRPKRLLVTMMLIILALAVVRVVIENSISTTGIELIAYQQKLESYKRSNALLEESYLEKSSLTRISSTAKESGFIESKDVVYLSAPIPFALK